MVSGALSPAFAPSSALATAAGERHAPAVSKRLSGAASEHWSVNNSDCPAVTVSDHGSTTPLSPTFAPSSALAPTVGERYTAIASKCLSGAATEHRSVANLDRPGVTVSDRGWGLVPVTNATPRMRPKCGLGTRTIEVNLTLTITLTDWHSLVYWIVMNGLVKDRLWIVHIDTAFSL
jgi:hypothetical protein